MVSKSVFKCSGPRSFPERDNMNMIFNSDIVNLLLKTSGGETEGLLQLSVGGWVVVTCSRKCFAFVFLVLFKNGGRRVSPRFHLFISDVNKTNKEGGFKIFLRVCKGGKILFTSSTSY